MENNRLIQLIETSIRLELNSAALYHIFHEANPEDADFWWALHMEEKSHAMLLRAARDSFVNRGKFPSDLICGSILTLLSDNEKLEGLIEHHKINTPSRIEALKIALEIENNLSETQYGLFMEKEASSPVESALQQLNREDKDHDSRIRERLKMVSAES